MKTFDLKDPSGRVIAFEVSNLLVSRARACRIAAKTPGVRILRAPRRWAWAWTEPDDFCEFEVNGVAFSIMEPFGDNSRFWVGPTPARADVAELSLVRQAFTDAWGWPP